MALLDAYGRTVKRSALVKPQADAGITGIRQIWANSVAAGLTPQRLAMILLAADQGQIADYVTLAEEMEERDPHYASVLGTRKRKISGIEPIVEPASEDKADVALADEVREHIAEHDGFTDLVESLLDGLGKGFSVVEMHWDTTANYWVPETFEQRPQRHFLFDRETGKEIRLLDDSAPVDGVSLHPNKYLVHKPKLKSGHIARGGLARLVAFSWMCKAYTLKDWMAFAETYGLPLRIGRYGPSATAEDVQNLFTAVANIGTDAAAVLPESMKIDFQNAGTAQSEKIFENLARYLDEQISKAVLGQTMTSDNGSSMAQAEVHDDVRHDIAHADARSVTGTLNRDLIKPFIDLNHGEQARYPHLAITVEEAEDTDMILKHTAKLAGVGVRIKQSEVRAKMGYSEPDENDEVIGATPVSDAPTTALNRAMNETQDPVDDLEAIADEMLEDWEEVMDETLASIEAALEGAESFEEAMTKLSELGLPSGDLIDALVKGAFKARSIGDVHDG